jgi:hypothetical protein
MLNERSGTAAPRWARPRALALPAMACAFLTVAASTASAQATLPPVSLGAGLRTSFTQTNPEDLDGSTEFLLNSARLYVNGSATEKIKFMFNTEYEGATNDIGVLDAVARLEFSPGLNIWMGRFLPPSDRANLYGPYYAHHWAVYTDGIQNGHPFVFQGRDNGVAYWGDFAKLKVSAGLFDGESATGNGDVITAARAQYNFWDTESGYYLNGTYYGGKNLLAIGAAIQAQDGDTATTLDFLMERKIADDGSTVTIESEYANYDALGGYDGNYAASEGGYILGAYLFGKPAGVGKFELLGKFAKVSFTKGVTPVDEDYDQTTTEFNFNYVIKEFNARVMFFFTNTTFSAIRTDFTRVGVGLQIQM